MQVVNIRNIALSLCLGIFSFHLYVVNTYNAGFEFASTFGSRSLASEMDCTQKVTHADGGVTKGEFLSESYTTENCEYMYDVPNRTAEGEPIKVKIYVRMNGSLVSFPEDGFHSLADVTGVKNEPELLDAQLEELRLLIVGLKDEKLPELKAALEVKLAAAAEAEPVVEPEPVVVEPAVEPEPTVEPVVEPEPTVTRRRDTTRDDDEIDIDRIKDLIESYKDLAKKKCDFADFDDLNDIAEDFKEITDKNILELRRSDARDIAKDIKLEDLEGLERKLEDFEEKASDMNGDEDANVSEKISCLSVEAKLIASKEDQAVYYAEHIRPLVSGAIHEADTLADYNNVIKNLSTDEFNSLADNNAMITALTEHESRIAQEGIKCSKQVQQCIEQLRAAQANLKIAFDKTQDPAEKFSYGLQIKMYEDFLVNKLGATSTAPVLDGALVDGLINGETTTVGEDLSGQNAVLTRAQLLNLQNGNHLGQKLLERTAPEGAFSGRQVTTFGNHNAAEVKKAVKSRLELDGHVNPEAEQNFNGSVQ